MLPIVITIKFEQLTYSANETEGAVRPVLILSNPLSTDITVEVFNTNGSATGEFFVRSGVLYKKYSSVVGKYGMLGSPEVSRV